jgi:hypothetical protein
VTFSESKKLAPSGETARLCCVPTEIGESSTKRIRPLNRTSWREPRRHQDAIPIDEVGVFAGAIPIIRRGDVECCQIGMNDGIDAIPKLDCSITHCNQSICGEQSIFEIVVESDGVEHP